MTAPSEGGTPRAFHVCVDHKNAEWNQPQIEGDDCVLCMLFYLEAQESLLEEWQQRAQRAEDAIKEMQRPLDAQMARLNATVERLNAENEQLRSAQSATAPAEFAWLIEMPSARWGTGYYWIGVAEYGEWGTIEHAVRFSRKEDAERVIESLHVKDKRLYGYAQPDKYAACEHQWPPAPIDRGAK